MKVTVENMALPGNAHTAPGEIIERTEEYFNSIDEAVEYIAGWTRQGVYFVPTITNVEDNSREEFKQEVNYGITILRDVLNDPVIDPAKRVNGIWTHSDTVNLDHVEVTITAKEHYGNKFA